jgi:pantetheine-phosphate adenylyltransferase
LYKYMRVCVGGTFDLLHKGHKVLLTKAVQTAGVNGSVFIGVMSDKKVNKKGAQSSFEKRKQAIIQFLMEKNALNKVTIQPLFDNYGPTLKGDFDVILVSPETKGVAEEINCKRRENGKKPLEIVVVPFVLADDGRPISSTRIRNREIDENGIVLR